MKEIDYRKYPRVSKVSQLSSVRGEVSCKNPGNAHRVSTSLCRLAHSALRGPVSSDQGNSRQQSCAGRHRAAEGAARCLPRPLIRGAGGGRHRAASLLGRTSEADGPTPHILVRTPWFSSNYPRSPSNSLGIGHDLPLNERLHSHPGVVGRLRRVVVARRCARHHLRRVMVETPPRAGPSPPHGPARFFVRCHAPGVRPRAAVASCRPPPLPARTGLAHRPGGLAPQGGEALGRG